MANENVVMNNGDLTAVGRVTAAKVKVPAATDIEVGSNDTLVTVIGSTIASRCASLDPETSSIEDVIKVLKGTN